ncbi:MAG: hypothetical protein R2774_13100 [Saprospiraceae bacterium]
MRILSVSIAFMILITSPLISQDKVGTAKLYWRYPGDGALVTKEAPYRVINNKNLLGYNSPLKYNEDGINDLESSFQNKFDFQFDGEWDDPENYAKTFAFLKIRDLFSQIDSFGNKIYYEPPLKINVDISGDFVGFSQGVIQFGKGFNKPAAMDEFWLAFAIIDYQKREGGAISATPSALYNGYIDYLSQKKLGKIGKDPICNHYGLTGPGGFEFSTNAADHCFIGNGVNSNTSRNAFSTFLTHIHLNSNLGPELVTSLMDTILKVNPTIYKTSNPYEFIREFWKTGLNLYNDKRQDSNTLCSLENLINDYFKDCKDGTSNFSLDGGLGDLVIRDDESDLGLQPNPNNKNEWESPAIINRNSDDNVKENQSVIAGKENFLYIDVDNLGCQTIKNANLELYFSLPITGLSWDDDWVDKYVKVGNDSILVGGKIGSVDLNDFQELTSKTKVLKWNSPDIKKLGVEINAVHILAKIVSVEDPFYEPEVKDVRINVRKNNNIAWRVLHIQD